jgi:general secretion pathway protein J
MRTNLRCPRDPASLVRTDPPEVALSLSTRGRRPNLCGLGFTLIELVIALALIGLITLLLFSGLRLGTRIWEGVETLAERTAEPRIACNFLMQALTQARAVQVVYDAKSMLVFGGDAENLEFVAPLSEHAGTPGLYILRLSLEQGDVQRLVLTRWLLHPDVLAGWGKVPEWKPFDGGEGPSEIGPLDEDSVAGVFGSTLLLDDVGDLQIGYFGVAEGRQEPDWYSEWLDEPRMPLAVRMHLTTEKQTWPDMLVRLPSFGGSSFGFRSRTSTGTTTQMRR